MVEPRLFLQLKFNSKLENGALEIIINQSSSLESAVPRGDSLGRMKTSRESSTFKHYCNKCFLRDKLNVLEMKCLRIMTGSSRLDRVRNEVVRTRAARVDMNVLRWFGHVEMMDNERLLKKVMDAKVDGRSARGRPRFGWMDGVKRALNDKRMDVREESERARNRKEWQTIVTQF